LAGRADVSAPTSCRGSASGLTSALPIKGLDLDLVRLGVRRNAWPDFGTCTGMARPDPRRRQGPLGVRGRRRCTPTPTSLSWSLVGATHERRPRTSPALRRPLWPRLHWQRRRSRQRLGLPGRTACASSSRCDSGHRPLPCFQGECQRESQVQVVVLNLPCRSG
jgi:hypothetical protein